MLKKVVFFFVLSLFLLPYSKAECVYGGIGAKLMQDAYNKKIFLYQFLEDSTAKEAKIPIGAQIIAINGKKITRMPICKVTELIRGEAGTKVVIKAKYKEQIQDYEVQRKNFPLCNESNSRYSLHWRQVAPVGLDLSYIDENIINNLSYRYKKELLPYLDYWTKRQIQFNAGYEACLSYKEAEQNMCLMNLTHREINRTSLDMKLTKQKAYIKY